MSDNTKVFVCQACGHVHELGPYRLIKPRTPAEAEALVDALIEKAASTQHWWERGDWDTFYARLDQRDEARAALIAALTGGGE